MQVSRHARVAIAVASAAYLWAFAALFRTHAGSAVEALFLLGILGVVFPALAWIVTRRQSIRRTPAVPVPTSRIAALFAYFAVFAALVLGWGFSALEATELDPRTLAVAKLALKLATMCLLPWWLFARPDRGWHAGRDDHSRNLIAFGLMLIAMLAFQAVFGRGLKTLAELGPALATLAWAVPACALWQVLEAGLCEEFLFRRILQERLAGATGSQVAAVLWSALLFGIAHAPGLWMRGGHLMEGAAHATPAWALAYSVVMIAPAGIVFGVLWARTRCLWLVVVLHGLFDLLPQLAPFIRTWERGGLNTVSGKVR